MCTCKAFSIHTFIHTTGLYFNSLHYQRQAKQSGGFALQGHLAWDPTSNLRAVPAVIGVACVRSKCAALGVPSQQTSPCLPWAALGHAWGLGFLIEEIVQGEESLGSFCRASECAQHRMWNRANDQALSKSVMDSIVVSAHIQGVGVEQVRTGTYCYWFAVFQGLGAPLRDCVCCGCAWGLLLLRLFIAIDLWLRSL